MEEKFFIWNAERDMWWKANRMGYTNDLSEAGVYAYKDAFEIVSDANRFSDKTEEIMVLTTNVKQFYIASLIESKNRDIDEHH